MANPRESKIIYKKFCSNGDDLINAKYEVRAHVTDFILRQYGTMMENSNMVLVKVSQDDPQTLVISIE